MNILVTGGCGFIGSNLIPALVQAGYRVRVLDNFSTGSPDALAAYSVEIIEGDIRDMHAVMQAMQGMNAVVHLAAQAGVIPSRDDPRMDYEINVGGTLNLLLASQQAGVERFVFASSNAPLGDAEQPVDESRVPRPLSPYGASKLAGEGYCSAFYGSFGVQTICLRFANVYGPRSSHKESVVARFIRDIDAHGKITIYGDGTQTRDMIYVDDLCQAIMCALTASNVGGEVFQIATGIETTVLDLAHLVCTGMERPQTRIQFLPARPGEIVRNYARIDHARAMLHWSPQITLRDGIMNTCQWFMQKE